MTNSKPKKYWKDINHVRKEIDIIMHELGRFPTQREIANRVHGLPCAIYVHHGGLNKLRALYALQPMQKEKGYYRLRKNVEQ